MTTITVPGRIVGYLRDSLHIQLGLAGEDIGQASDEGGREQPELYADPIDRLDRTRALLDAIGWKNTRGDSAITISMAAHRDMLQRALYDRLEAERYLMSDDPSFDGAARQITNAKRRAAEIERFLAGAGVAIPESD